MRDGTLVVTLTGGTSTQQRPTYILRRAPIKLFNSLEPLDGACGVENGYFEQTEILRFRFRPPAVADGEHTGLEPLKRMANQRYGDCKPVSSGTRVPSRWRAKVRHWRRGVQAKASIRFRFFPPPLISLRGNFSKGPRLTASCMELRDEVADGVDGGSFEPSRSKAPRRFLPPRPQPLADVIMAYALPRTPSDHVGI